MGKVVRRTQKERDLAIDIVKNGGSFEDAASMTGYCVDYVRQLCTKDKVHTPKFVIDGDRERKALNMIKSGAYLEDIISELGYSIGGVRGIARRHGLHVYSHKPRGRQKTKVAVTIEKEVRHCKRCGKKFECHPHSNQKFCSVKCQKAYAHSTHDILRRQRIKDKIIDDDITLEKVAERDHDICQICGKLVDWNDYKIVNGKKVSLGDYPSRDHIVPLCKGGSHSWENIRLAHIRCNSRKGARANG